jgi:hypothetical protein
VKAPKETHSVLIMDQSPDGQSYGNELAAGWAPVEERSAWNLDRDRATEGCRFGFIDASALEHHSAGARLTL